MISAGQGGSGAGGRKQYTGRLPGAETSAPPPPRPPAPLRCQRCGIPVVSRAVGCKNPCANCGTIYPLGDCSD